MKITKSMLSLRFTDLCSILGIPYTVDQALVFKSDSYAILDYDRVNGGYLPVMLNYTTGTQSGFMRRTSMEKRLPLSKMYGLLCTWYDSVLFVKENGFAPITSIYSNHHVLEKSDIVTVHARRYVSGSNTYHCVEVFVNGSRIGIENNQYGYESAFLQTANDILNRESIYVDKNDPYLRRIRAKLIVCVSDVRNAKEANF